MRRTALLLASTALGVLLASGVALVGVQEGAHATFPGQNGRIAYIGDFSAFENQEIYSMRPDGTDRTQLTDNTTNEESPDISPDGTEIAFVGYLDGVNKVYVMNADGTEVRNLSGAFGGDDYPAFSPDGTKIAFSYRGDIWVMDADDGSGRKNITKTGPADGRTFTETDPSWSPDGTKIAFVQNACRPCDVDLYTINANGTRLKQLTDLVGKEYAPDWSPSGHRIAFSRTTKAAVRTFTIKLDGTGRRLIAADGGSPVWSPDGKRIAFSREGDIYKVKSESVGEPVLIEGPAESYESGPDWGPVAPFTG